MVYNRVILVGRLTRDPELRATPDGLSVARFTLAVNRVSRSDSGSVADFFDVVAFRQLAETVANYAAKGTLILVEGRLQTRSYTDREGVRRKSYEIVADTVRFLERRQTPAAATETATPHEQAPPTTAHAPNESDEFDDIVLDESESEDPFH